MAQMIVVQTIEPRDGTIHHSHGDHRISIARIGFCGCVSCDQRALRRLRQMARPQFGHHCQQRQNHGPAQRDRAQNRMQQEHEDQEDRHPRQIEHRRRGRACEEPAQRIHLPPAIQRFGCGKAIAWHLDRQFMRYRSKAAVHPCPDPHHDLGPQRIEGTVKEEHPESQCRQKSKRFDRTAGQSPVIDLHHVDRPGQSQNVDQPRNHEDPDPISLEVAADHLLGLQCLANIGLIA